MKKEGELVPEAAPSTPGTKVEAGENGLKVGGSEVFGVFFESKDQTDVCQQFYGGAGAGELQESKDGGASLFRPRSADAIGNVEQRLGAILLAGAEAEREFVRSVARGVFQRLRIVFGPLLNLTPELNGFIAGSPEVETSYGIRGSLAPQENGNAAGGERTRQVSVAGKNFGTEEGILLTAKGVDTPSSRTRVEPSEQRLALRRAEGVVAVVEEESCGRGFLFFVFVFVLVLLGRGVPAVTYQHVPDRAGFAAVDPLGRVAKKLEKIQKQGLAGL